MKKFYSLLVLGIFYFTAFSQTEDVKKVDKIISSTYTPAKKSTFLNAISQINLTSSFGDEEASATVGYTTKKGTSFSLYLSQSFEEKPKIVTPVNLDGLQANSSFEVAFQHILWNPEIEDRNVFSQVKLNFAERTGKLLTPFSDPKKIDTVKTLIDDSLFKLKTDTLKSEWSTPGRTRSRLLTEINAYLLRDIGAMDFDEMAMNELYESKAGIDWKNPVLIGAAFSLGTVNPDYIIDSFSTPPQELKGVNFNVRFSIGTYLNKQNIIAFSYIIENKYKIGDPVNYSFPVGTAGLTYNKDVLIGKPKTAIDNRFKLEYRANWYHKTIQVLAINPQISYYTSKKILSFEMPIYFLNYKKDDAIQGLQGGVSFGLLKQFKPKEERDASLKTFAVSVFIAAPFEMLGLFKTR